MIFFVYMIEGDRKCAIFINNPPFEFCNSNYFFLSFMCVCFFLSLLLLRYQHTDHAEKKKCTLKCSFFRFVFSYLFLYMFRVCVCVCMKGMCNSLLLTTFFDVSACVFVYFFFQRISRQIDTKMRHIYREKQLIGLLCAVNKYTATQSERHRQKKQQQQQFVLPYFYPSCVRSCVYSFHCKAHQQKEKNRCIYSHYARKIHEIATKTYISPYLLCVFFSSV